MVMDEDYLFFFAVEFGASRYFGVSVSCRFNDPVEDELARWKRALVTIHHSLGPES